VCGACPPSLQYYYNHKLMLLIPYLIGRELGCLMLMRLLGCTPTTGVHTAKLACTALAFRARLDVRFETRRFIDTQLLIVNTPQVTMSQAEGTSNAEQH